MYEYVHHMHIYILLYYIILYYIILYYIMLYYMYQYIETKTHTHIYPLNRRTVFFFCDR